MKKILLLLGFALTLTMNAQVTTDTNTSITGTVITFAGSKKVKGKVDGIGTNATFQDVYRIFSDDKYLYVTHGGDYNFITRKTPFVIRKIDLATKEVSTLATISDNMYDNANEDKAKAASIVSDRDSITLGISHRFYRISIANGGMRSTILPDIKDSYGKLIMDNGILYSLGASVEKVNTVTGEKTSSFAIPDNGLGDFIILNGAIYASNKINVGDHGYKIFSTNITTQDASEIDFPGDGGIFGYGFDQIASDGKDIYFISNGRNGATYHFGKVNLASEAVTFIGKKDKGFQDGTLDESIFDGPISLTYTNGSFYILENGNLLIRKVTIDTGLLSYNTVTYNNTVTISPNPAKDKITIDCGNIADVVGYQIKITNSLGQVMFNQPMNTQQFEVSLNNWTGQGMYFVNIINQNGIVIDTKKIILQ